MEELRAILIKYNALDIFCDAIVDKRTKSDANASTTDISRSIDYLINWANIARVFGGLSGQDWQRMHIEFRESDDLGKFNCTREEIASRLRSKKTRLHNLIVGGSWMN